MAVSLSVATSEASLPIAYPLHLPEPWAKDAQRRKKAGIPKKTVLQSKLEIPLEHIRQAIEQGVLFSEKTLLHSGCKSGPAPEGWAPRWRLGERLHERKAKLTRLTGKGKRTSSNRYFSVTAELFFCVFPGE